jgi:aspartate/methionine/tyrosine aminotransferase
MTARVKELQAQGIDILDLTAGEPDFTPPTCVEEAAIKAIHEGRGRYTAAAGMMELRKAVAEQVKRELGMSYAPEQIVVTNGAKIGIAQTLMVMVESGDNVLVPTPCWTSYPEMVKLAEGEARIVECGADLLPSVESLEAARDQRTAALMLNSPCNPTGMVFPEQLLREIGEWAVAHGVRIISDEIYATLTYGGAEHFSPLQLVPELQETSVWIGGMSKAYAMTGWRMGFLAAPLDLAKSIAKVQSQLAGSPNAISMYASLAALQHADAERESMRQAFEGRCRIVVDALSEMPGVDCPNPSGAFYAFAGVKSFLGKSCPDTGRRIETGDDLVELLLEADQVATIGGSAFGAPEAFRISFATSEEVLKTSMARIAARLAKLE